MLFFTFDNIKGKKVIDESGNGNDGVMKGEIKVVPSDIFENAMDFSGGPNDVIEVPDSDSLDVEEITIEAWWFQRSLPGDYPRGIQKGIGTSFEFDADSRGGKKAIDWWTNRRA